MFKKYGGTLIFSEEDDKGPVEVIDTPTIRYLHTGSSIQQSSMIFDDPFALEMEYNQVMMLPLLFNMEAKRVLFLGLGGGAKPKFLWKHFPNCHVDCCEWSSLIIDVATRYFAVPNDSRMTLICQDAFNFLEQVSSLYDFIWIDLYLSNEISPHLGKEPFFDKCKRALKPDGILVWNRGESSPPSMLQKLQSVFTKGSFTWTNSESPNLVHTFFKKDRFFDNLQDRAELLHKKTRVKLFSNFFTIS